MAVKISAAPASSNDQFNVSEDGGISSAGGLPGFTVTFDVRANDGKAKTAPLYSLDDGQSADLLTADPVRTANTATDRSRLGAAIWINADGTVGYSTVPIAASIESLALGQTIQDSFLYATRQTNGSLLWSTATVTITGTNDRPVATFDSASVTEDSLISGSVATNDRDVDAGAILRFSTTDTAAGFALSGDGSWALDASHSSYQSLGAGETKTVNISYTVTDQYGATDRAILTIIVTGTNDRPVATAASASVNEDGNVAGALIATDADLNDTLSYAVSGTVPSGFALASNGLWTFDASTAAYQHLPSGEAYSMTVPYVVTDSAGTIVSSTLTISLIGTNDRPVATAAVANVQEGSLIGGQLVASDADLGSALTYAAIGELPGLQINSLGAWLFDASDAAYQGLADGETRQFNVGYIVTDNEGAAAASTLTITVTGTNDAPVAMAAVAAVDEGSIVIGDLRSTASDPDAAAYLTFDASAFPAGFSLSSNGAWSFDASEAAYGRLGAGETEQVVIDYGVTDQHGARSRSTLTINVVGTNDGPVAIGNAVTAAIRPYPEATVLTGRVAATDADDHARLVFSVGANETPPGFVMGADGTWSFAPNFQLGVELADGESTTGQVRFTVTDEHGESSQNILEITLVGTNDAPIANFVSASVGEDGTIGGQWAGFDPDHGAVLTYSLHPLTNPPGFTLGANGNWQFDARHPAYQSLRAGEARQLEVGIITTDEHGASALSGLFLTVTGVNDAPTASPSSAVFSEDVTASGQLSGIDVDGGTALAYSIVGTPPASFSVAANGSWTFAPDASMQRLNAGESQNVVVTFNVADPEGAVAQSTLSLTITGVNDAPLAAPVLIATTENMTSSGRITATDADAGAVIQYQQTNFTNYGINIYSDGRWALDTNYSLFQGIAQGEVRDILVGYKATDQFGASTSSTITLRVTGVNDAPVGKMFNQAQPEGTVTSGKLNIVDPDAGATLTYTLIGTAPVGFTLASDGTATMDSRGTAYDYIGSGSSAVVSASYRVTDEFGASSTGVINYTIQGVNDRPVLTGDAYAVPTQYQGQSFFLSDQQLRQGWTDPDGDIVSVYDYPSVDHGTVTRTTGGFNILVDAGYVGALTITYVLSDNRGGSAFPILVANVTDAARVGGNVTGSTVEARYGDAGTAQAAGTLTIVDIGGDASFQSVDAPQSSAGGFGSFTVTASGAWQYQLDNSNPGVAALNYGQSLTDSFTVFAADGTAQLINLTIAGATDWTTAAPFAGTGDSLDYDTIQGPAGTENANSSVSGTDARDVVTGGSGAQTFDMLAGDDTVYAADGNDVVYAGDGRDYIMGQRGNDFVDGGIGDDTLFGGAGIDQLLGGDGNDSLYGGSASDVIEGGAGRDFITGGFGADTLTGGSEGDTFIFTDLRDSGDTITDFQAGLDGLMFAQIDANTSLAGDQAFVRSQTGPAAYSLWTVQNGANLEIYADVDGNPNTAEFSLTVLNTTSTSNWTL